MIQIQIYGKIMNFNSSNFTQAHKYFIEMKSEQYANQLQDN